MLPSSEKNSFKKVETKKKLTAEWKYLGTIPGHQQERG